MKKFSIMYMLSSLLLLNHSFIFNEPIGLGKNGGRIYEMKCQNGYVTKVVGRAGEYVDAIGGKCSSGESIDPEPKEGLGGTHFEIESKNGFIGIGGRGGDWVDQIYAIKEGGVVTKAYGGKGGKEAKDLCNTVRGEKLLGLLVTTDSNNKVVGKIEAICGIPNQEKTVVIPVSAPPVSTTKTEKPSIESIPKIAAGTQLKIFPASYNEQNKSWSILFKKPGTSDHFDSFYGPIWADEENIQQAIARLISQGTYGLYTRQEIERDAQNAFWGRHGNEVWFIVPVSRFIRGVVLYEAVKRSEDTSHPRGNFVWVPYAKIKNKQKVTQDHVDVDQNLINELSSDARLNSILEEPPAQKK